MAMTEANATDVMSTFVDVLKGLVKLSECVTFIGQILYAARIGTFWTHFKECVRAAYGY